MLCFVRSSTAITSARLVAVTGLRLALRPVEFFGLPFRPFVYRTCRGNHPVRRTTVPGMAACQISGQHGATFVRSEFVNVFNLVHFGEPRRLTSTAAPTQ